MFQHWKQQSSQLQQILYLLMYSPTESKNLQKSERKGYMLIPIYMTESRNDFCTLHM